MSNDVHSSNEESPRGAVGLDWRELIAAILELDKGAIGAGSETSSTSSASLIFRHKIKRTSASAGGGEGDLSKELEALIPELVSSLRTNPEVEFISLTIGLASGRSKIEIDCLGMVAGRDSEESGGRAAIERGFDSSTWRNPAVIVPLPLSAQPDDQAKDSVQCEIPFIANDLARSRLPNELRVGLLNLGISSFLIANAIGRDIAVSVTLGAFNRAIRWRRGDAEQIKVRLQRLAGSLAARRRAPVAIPAGPAQKLEAGLAGDLVGLSERHYRELLRHGQIIVIKADAQFGDVTVLGNTERLLGVSSAALASDRSLWRRIASPRDLRTLRQKLIDSLGRSGQEQVVEQELRVIHQETRALRWLMVRAIALHGEKGDFLGWEGYGVDISELREAQDKLRVQGKRVAALYAVAASGNLTSDPVLVSQRCLSALIGATESDSGLVALVKDNGNSGSFDIVASHGVSSDYLERLRERLSGGTLLRMAIESGSGMIIENLQEDPRAARELATLEGIRASIIVPLMSEGRTLGALALFNRRPGMYRADDLEVVQAAAQQIASQIRQAEFYLAERSQARTVNLLYRFSHELSRYSSSREIVEHALPLLRQEFALKRIWCGIVSESGLHLMGQAGFGPGVRSSIIAMRIDLKDREDLLAKALRSRSPTLLAKSQLQDPELACGGLERLVRKLGVEHILLVPLTALGQQVGMLMLEFVGEESGITSRHLRTLEGIGSEMGAILLARRFESRLADAEKMRMAGLLASGVAHNFNNLLQAVMGQASLIEMQAQANTPVTNAARMIIEAANRGAGLIRQMMTFTAPAVLGSGESCDVIQLVRESADLYRSLLGSSVELSIDAADAVGSVACGASHAQQIMTHLLVNAREALSRQSEQRVTIRVSILSLGADRRVSEVGSGKFVRIEVEDNGPGMSEQQLARCFEPFYTTKNVDLRTGVGLDGAGLGLSSVYSALRSIGGTIQVSSTIGEGTVFSALIPLLSDEKRGEAGRLIRGGASSTVESRAQERLREVDVVAVDREELEMISLALSSLKLSFVRVPSLEGALISSQKKKDNGAGVRVAITTSSALAQQIKGAPGVLGSALMRLGALVVLVDAHVNQDQINDLVLGALKGDARLAEKISLVSYPVTVWSIVDDLRELFSKSVGSAPSGSQLPG